MKLAIKQNKTDIIMYISLVIAIAFGGFLVGRYAAPMPAKTETVKPLKASSTTQEGVLNSINEYRAEHGLPALARDNNLEVSAQKRADEIAACGRSCGGTHTRPDGTFFDSSINGNYMETGENIAECHGGTKKVIGAWEQSDLHNRNMLGTLGNADWGVIGVAQAWSESQYCNIVVAHFGRY